MRRRSRCIVGGVGLARPYYDNIFDIEALRVAQNYDKKTLGADLAAGDPHDLVNPLVRLTRKGSFEPEKDETSRVVGCAAVVAALRHPSALEFSVSSAAADNVPTSGLEVSTSSYGSLVSSSNSCSNRCNNATHDANRGPRGPPIVTIFRPTPRYSRGPPGVSNPSTSRTWEILAFRGFRRSSCALRSRLSAAASWA